MKAYMSERSSRVRHNAELLKRYQASEFEGSALGLRAEREALGILRETEDLGACVFTLPNYAGAARLLRPPKTGYLLPWQALAEALARFVED